MTSTAPPVHSGQDGRTLALVRRVEGNSDIWTMNLERGGLQRITTHAAHEASPVWAPDSNQLVFGSDRVSGVLDLFIKKVGATPEIPLIESTVRWQTTLDRDRPRG